IPDGTVKTPRNLTFSGRSRQHLFWWRPRGRDALGTAGKMPALRRSGAMLIRPTSSLVDEGEIQAGGEDYVVFLGAGWRVGDVDIAELVLPAQPLADLRDCAGIESPPVVACVLQVRIEVHVLGK